jgi:hypothetical protein
MSVFTSLSLPKRPQLAKAIAALAPPGGGGEG